MKTSPSSNFRLMSVFTDVIVTYRERGCHVPLSAGSVCQEFVVRALARDRARTGSARTA